MRHKTKTVATETIEIFFYSYLWEVSEESEAGLWNLTSIRNNVLDLNQV